MSFNRGEYDRELPGGPVFNVGEAVARAGIAELGIAQLPDAIIAGQLVPLLAELTCIRGDIWLVRPSQRAEAPRVKAFATVLEDMLAPNGT